MHYRNSIVKDEDKLWAMYPELVRDYRNDVESPSGGFIHFYRSSDIQWDGETFLIVGKRFSLGFVSVDGSPVYLGNYNKVQKNMIKWAFSIFVAGQPVQCHDIRMVHRQYLRAGTVDEVAEKIGKPLGLVRSVIHVETREELCET